MNQTWGTPVEIRPARVEDALAIARVHIETWKATYPGIVPQDYINSLDIEVFTERWRDRLERNPETLIYVADDHGSICGFASGGPARAELHGFTGELYAIYLSPQAQSHGIGKRLFWTIGKALRRAGHDGMYVWVLDENPSQGFYTWMGGRRLSETEIELGGRTIKEVSYGWSDLEVAVSQSLPNS